MEGTEAMSSRMISIEGMVVTGVQGYRFTRWNLKKAENEMRTLFIFKCRRSPHMPERFSIMRDMYIYICDKGNWTVPPHAFVMLSIISILCVIPLSVRGMYLYCWAAQMCRIVGEEFGCMFHK